MPDFTRIERSCVNGCEAPCEPRRLDVGGPWWSPCAVYGDDCCPSAPSVYERSSWSPSALHASLRISGNGGANVCGAVYRKPTLLAYLRAKQRGLVDYIIANFGDADEQSRRGSAVTEGSEGRGQYGAAPNSPISAQEMPALSGMSRVRCAGTTLASSRTCQCRARRRRRIGWSSC